MSISYRLW